LDPSGFVLRLEQDQNRFGRNGGRKQPREGYFIEIA
jgi:hypothetical protein